MENQISKRWLFRGKRPNGQWIIGNLCVYVEAYTKVRSYFIRDDDLDDAEDWAVDPATIGQCIGLKETYVNGEYKDGDLLFEGDIITVSAYSYHEPEADYFGVISIGQWGYGLYQPEYDGGKKWSYLCDLQGSYITHYSKQGNIHDNPELLTSDDNTSTT